MIKSDLQQAAKETLKQILDKPGEVIYSSHETLKKGDIYLMGLNPGGKEIITIEKHIRGMLTRKINSYLDESWPNGQKDWDKGKAPLQMRVDWLLTQLGYKTSEVCATNLIFTTSRSSDQLCFGIAGICWRFHEYVLDIVKPKIIIVFGNSETSPSPYFFLKSLFYKGEQLEIDAGHGKWVCKGFHTTINGNKLFVAGLPHMSYYNPIGKQPVIDWIKENGHI